ncbi:hypothetical protein COT44_04680 [Candidatus Shapirobacteria bacterium CG08_land_8_20_14_0_20_39_18]|uniref:Uncharacterized protein n=1 Tax=Candidatus Shapirobacteria bacterium CG08_land_8_20_14_0_20_39_18 TaxID=1974883 RepID=A0A2M6XBW7_9BACT|nr:MAG: hypothetical protein COT44_04680 [Candidatus Shapirobacteria bacterium CG08_land_8_20_14_0_20_39_18]PIY65350.1 MAG: hypothetical protein COY91_02970 [Candidatus Shapirobacteria bacterium CG_4_10_14_0_8_um_filter_39_15]PJE68201.1 MAG: hypothetical protein COU94_03145 [Candidatus Shapirobacteria bacterium CG10_big_fil_rev_8_21_14_0_10_38_8]
MLKKYQHLFSKDQSFLILCSKPLDSDSLGSGLILKKYLESLGKKCKLVFPREITEEEKAMNSYLPYFDEIETKDTRELFTKKAFDVLIFLDGTNSVQYYDTDKTPDNSPNFQLYTDRIRIDHHHGNPEKIGTINIHFPKLSSTAEVLLTKIIPDSFIDQEIATLGYAALVGDTGNFQWNFSASTLRIAGKLISKRADWELVLDKIFFSKSKSYFDMLAYVIQNSEYYDDLGTCFVFLPYKKLQKDQLDEDKLKDLKQSFQDAFARRVIGYPRGIIVYEKEPGRVYVSVRGNNLTNNINFPKILMEIGGNGGGHFNATGFDVKQDFKTVKNSLIQLITKYTR